MTRDDIRGRMQDPEIMHGSTYLLKETHIENF